jgi:acetate CoA/acetoacetate CoA-transferase beta subunit
LIGLKREEIARRISLEIKERELINLGIGIPTLVANYIPDNSHIIIQAEDGIIRQGPAPDADNIDIDYVDASCKPTTVLKGGAVIDSSFSFGLIRGGHISTTILGALQVDERGNMASWKIPGIFTPGIGGSMDLVTGAKKVIVAMNHTDKDGRPKLLKKCTLPLTGKEVVNMVVTNLGVFKIEEKKFILTDIAKGVEVNLVKELTEAEFIISDNLKEI